jgi:hypothetical protein
MPWDGATTTTDRPGYDDARKAAAARILYADLDPRPRIRGLETVAVCRAWLQVEGDRDAPRQQIIAAINQRLRALQDGDADASGERQEAEA